MRLRRACQDITFAATVPLEDAILSHLAETQYDAAGFKNSELDNFLAVSSLNAHLKARSNPELRVAKAKAQELLNAIDPQVTAALGAPIYGYYFRSTDLIVADDPLLLRKHRYVDFLAPGRQASVFMGIEVIRFGVSGLEFVVGAG